MDLIKEIAPYKQHLDAYVKTKTMTDHKAKNALVKIWDAFINIPENSTRAYGRETKVPHTDMTCDDCKMKAIKKIVAWSKELQYDVPKIAFKGVKSEVKEVKSSAPESTPATNEEMIAFYKTHLNAAGISYHHKAGVKKLEELYNTLKGI
jgi:hypothetical protein